MTGRQVGYLGIDVGTSSTKVAVLDADGRLVADAAEAHSVSTPQPGHVETDPVTWRAAVDTALRRIGPSLADVRLRAAAVVGQMHGAVLCDHTAVPLAPAILWPDRRAEHELGRWHELPDSARGRLANPIVPGMTGPILAWLAAHRPELVDRAAVVLLPKDVVRAALSGRSETHSAGLVTDRSDASATLLWDVAADRWAADICSTVGVGTRLLPEAIPSATLVGETSRVAELVDGATAAVPLVAGAGDTPAALLAVGSVDVLVNLGTGAQVLVGRPTPERGGADPSTHLYADAGGGWYAMAALQNGGLALDWAARALGLDWAGFLSAIASGRSGAATFLPFVTGERGGVASPASRGGWLDLRADTTRNDLARATAEGVLFAIRRGTELLGDATGAAGPVTLSGGGWRSALLCQLAADVLNRPVQRLDVRSASATGAALLAARGVGDEVVSQRSTNSQLAPTPDNTGIEAAYRTWLDRVAAAEH
jgi:xylulokinase